MTATGLRGCSQPLAKEYDAALLDLDGVVYVGEEAVPEAADAIRVARDGGMGFAFVTNNAARTPAVIATHLTQLGVPTDPHEVVTSSMAAAHLLTTLIPAGSTVLVVGGDGLLSAVAERGFVSTDTDADAPVAVVQGYGPDVSWRSLAEASVAVRRGVPWVATNLDTTLPSPRGPLPGNGALVGTVVAATGRSPISAGKPELPLHEEAVRRTNARHPLVVGDRLDTDIEGAVRAGCDSLLVLTGVTDVPHLLSAKAHERPSYIARDLRGLNTSHPAVTVSEGVASCGGWQAARVGDAIEVRRDAGAIDVTDGVRAVLTASWQDPGPSVRLRGDVAALAEFGLA